jgi:hypothetical protein
MWSPEPQGPIAKQVQGAENAYRKRNYLPGPDICPVESGATYLPHLKNIKRVPI